MLDAQVTPILPGISPDLEAAVRSDPAGDDVRARRGTSFAFDKTYSASPQGITPLGAESLSQSEMLCSVFIQLDRDLDPNRKRDAKEKIRTLCPRVRWKGQYASADVRRSQVVELSQISGVAYVEPGQSIVSPQPDAGRPVGALPDDGRLVRCEDALHKYGRDVLVGIIDVGGFDFGHEDFLVDGQTRWVGIWDQGGDRRPPPTLRPDGRDTDKDALQYGAEITKEHMARAIRGSDKFRIPAALLEPQSQMVSGSHGTHVASIAAGNKGVARQAQIAGVLLELADDSRDPLTSFYDSTRIADAVEYLLDLAAKLGTDGIPMPLSINISLGTNGHAHDGTSPIGRWIDDALSTRRRCVTVAAGNAGQTDPAPGRDTQFLAGRVHAAGKIGATSLRQELKWIVRPEDYSDNKLQVWYQPQDRMTVELRPPGGSWITEVLPNRQIVGLALGDGTEVSIYSEIYYPANGLNRISILLSPGQSVDGSETPITHGEWRVRLTGIVVRDGGYDAWIERDDPARLDDGNRWSYPSFFAEGSFVADKMINSLACADRIISVANVDLENDAAHYTSSRGPTRHGRPKPDLGAEGTRIVAARALGGDNPWVEMTGTSMAAPYVCGVAALMLAISPNLFSTQIQGMMLATASPLVGHGYSWRNDTGFGLIDASRCVGEAAQYLDQSATAEKERM
jgi:subtilisin family serine protease